MTQAFRLAAGGRIDRERLLRFHFDGRAYHGYAGDTLASALLANGVHLMARSFKYHRPRGPISAGAEEPNALVEIDRGGGRRTPNLRATQVPLFEGLFARSQNRFPSLRVDLGAAADWAAPLIPAGFYYKTFLWPAAGWSRLYEPLIRRAAGLGRAPDAPDPDHYATRHVHCDVLVAGAGPAGLAAACAAAATGARVILCDEQEEPGGSLLGDPAGDVWVAARQAELLAYPTVRVLPRTTAFGYFAANFVALAERVTEHMPAPPRALPRERLWQVRARQVVLAAGAIERPLVFPGNDRPGVMLAGAAAVYARRWAVRPGRRAVVLAACDTGYDAALALHRAGVAIALVADTRVEPGPAAEAARAAGLPVAAGMAPLGTEGRLRVRSVELAHPGGRRQRIGCDLLCMAGGWTPSIHLFSQSRGRPRFDAALGAFVPDISAQAERSAGACRGVLGLAEAIADGAHAGAVAAAEAGLPAATWSALAPDGASPPPTGAGLVGAFSGPRGRAFVDFQNDVTVKDLRLAVVEGFRSVEHVKRYTTTGMATDQGKTSNVNAIGIVAGAIGVGPEAVGLTTFRTPTTPVSFGALAGAARGLLFDPERRTPLDAWAAARSAAFENVGQWRRARCFPAPGETHPAAGLREARAVRASVGLFDASSLGKIEVVGPDAGTFLERMYVVALARLGPGRSRYALMLNEAGFVIEDGIIARLAPDRFHVTTTTGNAAMVLARMEEARQTIWPDLHVWCTSITEQWAVIAVQGPLARATIAPLVSGIDLDAVSLPHMGIAEGTIAGGPLRLFRASFTGELGFELNVPPDAAAGIWGALWPRVAAAGGGAYGTDAMHLLRAEKGYVIVGQDSDGTATPDDLGLGGMVRRRGDFIGRRSLALAALAAPGRRQLVGLRAEDGRPLEEGVQLTETAAAPRGTPAIGRVTSAYPQGSEGTPVTLGMLTDGRARTGATVHAQMPGGARMVRVVAPCMLDPDGARLHA